MKRLLIFAIATLLCMPIFAQGKLFVVFEMMKVDNEQHFDYMETEKFWKGIHQKRVDAGEIVGWDLWSLLPGGENQGYQFATATLFDSAEKMFAGSDFWSHAKAAYPNMSEEDISNKIKSAAKSRDLAVRIFMETIAETKGDLKMNVGTVASIDFMKVKQGDYSAYEQAEMNVFQPQHQKMVDSGSKSYWGLLRFMIPTGSDTYASHITINMFDNIKQALAQYDSYVEPSADQKEAIQEGLKTRDLKITNMATLIEMVR